MKNKKASLDQINLAGSIRVTQTTDLVELMRSSHVNPSVPTAVAFSGGADSTALLIASADYWKLHSQAAGTLTPLRAVHIHHGLQAAADSFAEHCTSVCDRLQVPLHIEYIKASHRLGESPEEAARLARYKAFASVLSKEWGGEVRTVLLGQHADDQVETLLLALSRGAGLPGLSSMAPNFERMGVQYYRPFLDVSSQVIKTWLRERGQAWIEDPTNQDTQFTRNKIRVDVVPSIYKAFPAFRQTAARSARHAAQAQLLLNELAQEDLHRVGNPPKIKLLQTLSVHRCANVLRFWFASLGVTPSNPQLQELISQIGRCKTRGHKIELKLGLGFVTRTGEVLAWSELLQ